MVQAHYRKHQLVENQNLVVFGIILKRIKQSTV